MSDVRVLAIDLAKRSFQVCGTNRGGTVYSIARYRARIMINMLEAHEPCIVAMQACATSHGAAVRRRCLAGAANLCEAFRQAAEE